MTNAALDDFVAAAKAVTIGECLSLLHLPAPKGGRGEYMGPCPQCGGRDRFSFNTIKNVWNCRGCAVGGHSALGLAGHVLGLNLSSQEGYLEACSAVLGRPIPGQTETETEEQRKAREQRAAALAKKAQEADEKRQKLAEKFRMIERRKAAEKWRRGYSPNNPTLRGYFEGRIGGFPKHTFLGLLEHEKYYDAGEAIYTGAAMVAPFVDETGNVIGCHLTWLDRNNPPKYRPNIVGKNGDKLPTKKMRGSKKGGLIPLVGFIENKGRILPAPDRHRMVVAEGIENVAAVCLAELNRQDTIYAAAGDLGNLAGPADPKSRFIHPAKTVEDKNGHRRPVYVAGPVPLFRKGQNDSIFVPPHITELVFIADSDSEQIMTAAAMARADARFKKAGRKIIVTWPPRGLDVADMMQQGQSND